MKIATILDQIDLGSMALPEFQRGFVWNRDQVRSLMHSLYLGHPVGSLLVWATKTETADARGQGELSPGSVKLLLDGQQRITSLYGIIRGNPPAFFEGNPSIFSGLHFNLEEESFEFYAPMKMKDNLYWINVTELLQQGVGTFIQAIVGRPELAGRLNTHINRLTAIENIKQRDLYVEEVTGEDKTVDVVVDIFNRVNSGGTKLSKGDLALARICAAWPEARDELKARLRKWREAGFHFKMEWLLRCVNTVLTGEALFSALRDIRPAEFREGMHKAEKAVDLLLNLISSRLGLDHDRVLGGRYALPLMARYVMDRGGRLQNHRERDRLLFWYVHTFLWGRYAGSTESVLNQDLALIEEKDRSLERLIDGLRFLRGKLSLQAGDFRGWSRGARFYPLLYMLTRVHKARDWDTGVELSGHLLGNLSQLQLHHIFPKSVLYDHGYTRPEVNALANFTFLTQETNLLVSNRRPEEYVPEFLEKQPGAVESHWIPTDPVLWKVKNYAAFLDARRELLAAAANEFLEALSAGAMPETECARPAVMEKPTAAMPAGAADEDEESLLDDVNQWITEQGLPEGELVFELVDEDSGDPRAVLDLAWPNGLQEGYSQPVALILDESKETLEAASKAGYRCFAHADEFKEYVKQEVLALAGNEGG